MSRTIFEELKARVKLSVYLNQKFGMTFNKNMASCILHEDRTPSFHLIDDERWHCFSCGAGGDVVDLVAAKMNFPTMDAVRVVAKDVGIEVSVEDERHVKALRERREKVSQMLDKAKSDLVGDMSAEMYLERRKIENSAIEHFGLGYVAEVKDREGKNLGDAISIPLKDRFDKVVGYSMRLINPGDEGKYKNSYQDDLGLFVKREIIYNIGASRKAIKENRCVYIVEGYFDVISMWQMGFTNTVGICQAIMTKEQMKHLHDALGPTDEIIIIPDFDKPGLEALEKNIAAMRVYSNERSIKVAMLEGGKDIADLFVVDKDKAKEQVAKTKPAEEFLIERLVSKEGDKVRQYQLVKPIIMSVSPLMRDDLVTKLAHIWGKDRSLIADYFNSKSNDLDSQTFSDVLDMASIHYEYVMEIDTKRMRYGLPSIDRMMRGVPPGEYALLQARTSVGKTAVALNIASHWSRAVEQSDSYGLFFSLEMNKPQVFERMMQIANAKSGTEIEQMVKLRDPRLGDFHESTRSFFRRVHVCDKPGLTLEEMKEYITYFATTRGHVAWVLVDYFGLIREESSHDHYHNESVKARKIKEIAKETKSSWLVLHQLSRKGGTGGERVTLDMGRDSVVGDSRVWVAGEGQIPIRELVGKNPSVVCVGDDYKYKIKKAYKVWEKGKRDIFKVTTRRGYEIRVTSSHPLLTADRGMVRLRDLKPGDAVAMASGFYSLGGTPLPEAEILGHMLANGGLTEKSMSYTCGNRSVLERFVKCASEFGVSPRVFSDGITVRLPRTLKKPHKGPNPLRALLEKHGSYWVKSPKRIIPESIWRADLDSAALFIKAYWSNDGHVDKTGVHVVSASKDMALGFMRLLLRFGIVADMQKEPSVWRVSIRGHRHIRLFSERIGLIGDKQKKIERLHPPRKILSGHRFDVFTASLWSELHASRKKSGLSWKEAFGSSGVYEKRDISRAKLESIAARVGSKRLSDLASSDLYFDEIETIKRDGHEPVFDIAVVGIHNFVADGFSAANSGVVEEAAYDLIGLWRPELEKDISVEERMRRVDESAMMWGTLKQRNGPTGEIKLIYDRRTMRLEDPGQPAHQPQMRLPGERSAYKDDEH